MWAWCWHRRSRWESIVMRSTVHTMAGARTTELDGQSRHCVRCGKEWRRKIKVKG